LGTCGGRKFSLCTVYNKKEARGCDALHAVSNESEQSYAAPMVKQSKRASARCATARGYKTSCCAA
jgi:hypothetical protein